MFFAVGTTTGPEIVDQNDDQTTKKSVTEDGSSTPPQAPQKQDLHPKSPGKFDTRKTANALQIDHAQLASCSVALLRVLNHFISISCMFNLIIYCKSSLPNLIVHLFLSQLDRLLT